MYKCMYIYGFSHNGKGELQVFDKVQCSSSGLPEAFVLGCSDVLGYMPCAMGACVVVR